MALSSNAKADPPPGCPPDPNDYCDDPDGFLAALAYCYEVSHEGEPALADCNVGVLNGSILYEVLVGPNLYICGSPTCNIEQDAEYCIPKGEVIQTGCEKVKILVDIFCADEDEKCRILRECGCDCGGAGKWRPPEQPIEGGLVTNQDSLGDPFPQFDNMGGINIASGTFTPSVVDLALSSPGFSWKIARATSPNTRDAGSGLMTVSDETAQGFGWLQLSEPTLEVAYGPGSYRQLTIKYHPEGSLQLMETEYGSNLFIVVGSQKGAARFVAGTSTIPNRYEYYDLRGTTSVFFDPADTNAGDAKGHLWTITDAAGNKAWIGHPTNAITATTAGYGADGIKMAVDPGNRRYTYTYSTSAIGLKNKLLSVAVDTKTAGTWEGTYTIGARVADVTYDYYTSTDSGRGLEGDLRTVTVELPLSDTSLKETRVTYYRYYTDTTVPGLPHMLKMIVGPEGTRRFDWDGDSDFDQSYTDTVTSNPLTSDSNLGSYAEKYFEYTSSTDVRISKFFSNGQCGCVSGGSNGVYELTYEAKPSPPTNYGYDEGWYSRTVMKQPDGTYVTYYVDERFQPWAEVRTDVDPASTGTVHFWATWYKRDPDTGRTKSMLTPAAISAYVHSTSGTPVGSLTARPTDGLVYTYEYFDSGPLEGMLFNTKWKVGDSGTTENLISTRYAFAQAYELGTTSIGSPVRFYRIMPYSTWDYSEEVTTTSGPTAASGSHEHLTEYTFYQPTDATDLMHLVPKVVTAKSPKVETTENGSGSAEATSQFLLADGRVSFTKSATAAISYTGYDSVTGLPALRISDADTTRTGSGQELQGITIPTSPVSFASAGSPLRYVSKTTYDPQGRLETSELPSGRVMVSSYSRLADRRVTMLSIPRRTTGPTTYYGPVGYSVSNLAGKNEFSGTVGLTGGPSTTALSSWITTTASDPITALAVGSLKRLSVSVYDSPGVRMEESRKYFNIPSSGSGSVGTNYDATKYGYDDMGRRRRTVDATGTISRTVFDSLGRATESWIGTNDNGWAGGSSSGTANMTKVAVTEYDGGNDKGNSYVTKRTQDPDGDWTTTTADQRVTAFINDVRGRAIVVSNAPAPHVVTKYDNENRVIARGTYNVTKTDLDNTSDPTTVTDKRLTRSDTVYDPRGQVWKSVRHKIDATDGSDDDTLVSLNWYDPAGRLMKVKGESGLTKTRYDQLGRATHRWTLAKDNDSSYPNIWDSTNLRTDVAGDTVLGEDQTVYDNVHDEAGSKTGNVMMRATISRFHDDLLSGTTGALDSNSDTSPYMITANSTTNDIHGRISITAMWYDALDRLTDTVQYGTNGSGNARDFDRRPSGAWRTVPSRSDTELVTSNTYDIDGAVVEARDPRSIVTRTLRDHAGRTTAVISNYLNGSMSTDNRDHDTYVRFVYNDGVQTKLWVDVNGNNAEDAGDQVTTYTYGTTKGTGAGDSRIATGYLLQKETYPDSSSSTDVVTHAYNALGQEVWRRDQSNNIVTSDFDTAGRLTDKRIPTLGTNLEDSARRIGITYTPRGQTNKVTQYNVSDAVLDEVQYAYDDWGNVASFTQDVDSAIGGSGRGSFGVSYTYDKATPTGGHDAVRRTTETLPDSLIEYFNYSSLSSSLADVSSRVSSISDGTNSLAEYHYFGASRLVGIDLPVPGIESHIYTGTSTYANLDRFGRVAKSVWNKPGGRDFYHVDLAYDRNSNITLQEDTVHLDYGNTGHQLYSAAYTTDGLNRLIDTLEGNLNSTSHLIDFPSRDQQWTLSQTGNWATNKIDTDGDSTFETNESSTFNAVNEQTALTRGSTTYSPTYNDAGELTNDGENYKYKYDAFGRLVTVRNRSTDAVVAEYRYNGLNYRIGWHYDSVVNSDVDSSDPWFFFCYDERWRIVATFRASDTSPKERFVWHAAGMNGFGNSSYIDTLCRRDRDSATAWTAAAGTIDDEHLFFCQNWRADVVAVLSDSGIVKEWIKYSAYGVPTRIDPADFNRDGFVTGDDYDWYTAAFVNGDPEADADFDGYVTGDDPDVYYDAFANASTLMGPGVLSGEYIANRVGYAGYQHTSELAGTKWHVRYRLFNSGQGTWTKRDPLGYVDGLSLFEYLLNSPINSQDPRGLVAVECGGGACGGNGQQGGWDSTAQPGGPMGPPTPPTTIPTGYPCAGDPKVAAALSALSTRGCAIPTFVTGKNGTPPCTKPNIEGASDCNTNTLTVCPFGTDEWRSPKCEIIAHELIHALDVCEGVVPCSSTTTCRQRACTELRAYAYSGQCCTPNSFGGWTFDIQCVFSKAPISVQADPACAGRSNDWYRDVAAQCFAIGLEPDGYQPCDRTRIKLPPQPSPFPVD